MWPEDHRKDEAEKLNCDIAGLIGMARPRDYASTARRNKPSSGRRAC
jgi:hypothetical protein